jgi:hypothetical protein
MNTSLASPTSSFSERVSRVLRGASYRRVQSNEEIELVYAMRRAAGGSRVDMRSYETYNVSNGFDNHHDHYNIMIYLYGQFVSTLRIQVGMARSAIFSSRALSPAMPFFHDSNVMIGVSRFATTRENACKFPELPYLGIRAAWLAAEHVAADIILLTCGIDHQSFYSRVFGFQSLGPSLELGRTRKTTTCMTLDFPAEKRRVEEHFPMFPSTPAERQSIFGPFERVPVDRRSQRALSGNWA